jgi:hypothetical protein
MRWPGRSERCGELAHGFSRCGEATQLFLASRAKFGRLGGRQSSGSAGCARRRAAFTAEFELELELELCEGRHDGCDSPPCRGGRVDSFA